MDQGKNRRTERLFPWLIVLSCCGMLTASFGVPVYCAGIFYVPIAKTLGAKLGEVALMLTIMNITHGILSPVVIKMCRKIDMRIMAGASMLGISLGFWCLSRVTSIWQIYCCAVFIGIFCAFSGMAIVPVILGNWFHEKSGMAIGIAHCVSGLAGAVMAPILKGIIESSSWRNAYICIAIISFIILIPAVVFMRYEPAENRIISPASQRSAAGSVMGAENGQPSTDEKRRFIAKLLLMCLITILATFGPGFGVHMSGYTESIGIVSAVSALLYSLGLVGGTISKLITGVSCDKIGAGKTSSLILGITAIGLGMLIFTPARMIALFAIAALLIGIGASMSGVGVAAITKQVFGHKDFAKAFSWVSIAAAIGSSSSGIVGFMVDRFHSYIPAIVLCIVFSCISIVLISIICRKKDPASPGETQ